MDKAANLAFFLQEETGSIFGKWKGTMKASDQRNLFGKYLGKGRLVIDGTTETIKVFVKVAFGQDSEMVANEKWSAL